MRGPVQCALTHRKSIQNHCCVHPIVVSCSRQLVECHMSLILKICKNYMSISVNILLGQPVQLILVLMKLSNY